jgi:hypothetical protein
VVFRLPRNSRLIGRFYSSFKQSAARSIPYRAAEKRGTRAAVRAALLQETLLKIERGADGLPGGIEDCEGRVSAELENKSSMAFDYFS